MLESSSAVFPGASERKSELGWKQSSQSSDWPSHGMLALQALCHNASTREALLLILTTFTQRCQNSGVPGVKEELTVLGFDTMDPPKPKGLFSFLMPAKLLTILLKLTPLLQARLLLNITEY